MQKSLKKIYTYIRSDITLCILLIVFYAPLYISIGLPLTDLLEYSHLSFNGSDPDAVIALLAKYDDYYFKTGRHPLFLIFNPIGLLLNLATDSPAHSALILTVGAGLITQILFFAYLRKCKISSFRSFLFTFLLGGSFSHIIFGAIPETFIYTAASILLILLINVSNENDNVFYKQFFPASVLAFGMAMTSLVPIVLILFHRFYKRKGVIYCLKSTVVLLVLIITTTAILAKLQSFIYGSTYFLNINEAHLSSAITLLDDAYLKFPVKALTIYSPSLWLNNIVGPHWYELKTWSYVCYYTGEHPVLWPDYLNLPPAIRLIAVFSYLFMVAWSVINIFLKKRFQHTQFILIFAYYTYCILFHSFFDPVESIVHSNLFTFPLVAIVAIGFKPTNAGANRHQLLINTILSLFVCIIFLNNLKSVQVILKLLGIKNLAWLF